MTGIDIDIYNVFFLCFLFFSKKRPSLSSFNTEYELLCTNKLMIYNWIHYYFLNFLFLEIELERGLETTIVVSEFEVFTIG